MKEKSFQTLERAIRKLMTVDTLLAIEASEALRVIRESEESERLVLSAHWHA